MVFKRSLFLLLGSLAALWLAFGAARADNASISPWMSQAKPNITKALDLPANALPASSNIDCTNITVSAYHDNTMQPDCDIMVPLGEVGNNGIIFNGTSQSIPVNPDWPFFGLQAVPNNNDMLTYTSSQTVGNYLHVYTSIRDKMKSTPDYVNGKWQYTITGHPDYDLKDASGRLLATNQNAMAFSDNGSWMAIDLPWQGFVRVNLSTLEILPFAPSMQASGDYSDHRAQLAISNDGQTVVVKPNGLDQFKVYDLGHCNGTDLPVDTGTDRCASRDYYGDLYSSLNGLRALYQPRFVNDTQLSLTAVYDYAPGNFKVGSFMLTAPGQPTTGIQYLGMGDSFASGEGAFDYTTGTDTSNDRCHLSSKSYPLLLTLHAFSSGHSVACSGAIMDDIDNVSGAYKGQVKDNIIKDKRSKNQLASYVTNFIPGYIAQSEFIDTYKPDAITLSIGGNDIGFADIIQSCVSPIELHHSCYSSYESRVELGNQIQAIFNNLVATYKKVLKPGKRVYVIGYPQIVLPHGDCGLNVHLDGNETELAANIIDYLNSVISQAADKAGVRYVDVSNAFVGHRLCEAKSSEIAVNGFTVGTDSGIGPIKFVGTESYHPNALGHMLLEQAIRTQTHDLTQPMPGAIVAVQPPAVPATFNDQSLPSTGRSINVILNDTTIAPDQAIRDSMVTLTPDAVPAAFKAQSAYAVALDSPDQPLATIQTDAAGTLPDATVHIPANIDPGFHVLHVYGTNIVDQPIDISKTIYIADSSVPTGQAGCALVPASGKDIDQDGIDDACDGFVGEPPAANATTSGSTVNRVTLSDNTIMISLRKP